MTDKGNKKFLITQEGYDKLQAELDELVLVGRPEVAARLKEAVGFGDLSENAEYDAARTQQSELERKILVLSDRLSRTEIVKATANGNTVEIGSKVTVIDEENEEVEYMIVGDNEGDLYQLKLSISSPVGSALMGKVQGQNVGIAVPNGNITYKILNVKN